MSNIPSADNTLIRPVLAEDIPVIQDLFYETWLDTYPNAEAGITREDVEFKFKDRHSPENIAKRSIYLAGLSADAPFYVAVVDGIVVGLARANIYPDKNQLQAIYVLPKFQGQGIGKKLWQKVGESFNPQLPTIVHVATYNQKAISFYKKLGFQETGKQFSEERHRMKSGNIIPETEMVMAAKG